MGLFDTKGEPVFLKEDSSAEGELAEMRALLPQATGEVRTRLEREIKIADSGLFGENQVIFQLKNSHLPLYVIRDLYLEHGGLTSQIDFLVITPYLTLVIECKNLVGNIEINGRGDFIRTFNFGHGDVREGMDSPITQNERHLQLVKAICQSDMGAILRMANDRVFPDFYKSVVVLANPKTILDDRFAKKEIKEQVVRADALIRHIERLNDGSRSNGRDNLRQMQARAEKWLSRGVEHHRDIAAEYGLDGESTEKSDAARRAATTPTTPDPVATRICPKCGAPMVLRTATRGERAGKKFWGCSTYPHCHCIINVDE